MPRNYLMVPLPVVMMDSRLASQRNLEPLGVYRGMAVAGCEPNEMGIGPVFAIPKLLARKRFNDG